LLVIPILEPIRAFSLPQKSALGAAPAFDELTEKTFLGVQATEDAVAALLADGSISQAAGKFNLTARGSARRVELVQHLADMERDLLKDVPESLQKAGRQVLQILAGD
jgi:hypothetical protein